MKTLLLSAFVALFGVGAMAQATPKDVYINFANTVLGGTAAQGGGAFPDHARILGFDGAPISGSGTDAGKYLVTLFYGPECTGAMGLLQAGAPTTFLDVPAGQTRRPGFFAGGRRDLIGIQTTGPGPGPIVELQVRVSLATSPNDWLAASRLFYARAGNGNNVPPDAPPNFSAAPPGGRPGFSGFGWQFGPGVCVPEPSSVALGLLGIVASVFVRRRK